MVSVFFRCWCWCWCWFVSTLTCLLTRPFIYSHIFYLSLYSISCALPVSHNTFNIKRLTYHPLYIIVQQPLNILYIYILTRLNFVLCPVRDNGFLVTCAPLDRIYSTFALKYIGIARRLFTISLSLSFLSIFNFAVHTLPHTIDLDSKVHECTAYTQTQTTSIHTMYLFKQNSINANKVDTRKTASAQIHYHHRHTILPFDGHKTISDPNERDWMNVRANIIIIILPFAVVFVICRANARNILLCVKSRAQNLLHLVDDGAVCSFRNHTVLPLSRSFSCRIVCAWFSKYVMNDDESGA